VAGTPIIWGFKVAFPIGSRQNGMFEMGEARLLKSDGVKSEWIDIIDWGFILQNVVDSHLRSKW
jgi:hypothetical protein